MYDRKITLFNYYENPEAEDAYWYPHVLSNVDLNTDRGAIIKKYGHDAADKAQLHILYGTDQTGQKVIPDMDGNAVPWLPPKEWKKQEGDRLMNSLTFSPESDFFWEGSWKGGVVADSDYRGGFFQYMENTVAESKNMSVQLSNEYQAIPADAKGNIIGAFPEVKTTVSVLYGTTDISNDCSYSVQKSDTVTGYWGLKDHTYTVTNLTGDSGWIDIRVTYLQTLSITKRFAVSKLYGGPAGRTFILEPSYNILKRDYNNAISPNSLEFKAYYMDGDVAQRKPYKGRMVIEETSDGDTWTTVYTSETDEDTVTHYLHTVLIDNSGQTITDGNGTTLGIPRDITNIRCKLYAAGGTTDMIDMRSVAVVLDVESLTAEQIVNILTNDGEWKGLYYLNGHLYLSFDAALGGILTLGGKYNGDGRIIMRRSDGTPYGSIDNDGITFFKYYTENDNGYEYEGYRITKDGVRKASGYKNTDPNAPDVEFEGDDEIIGNGTIIDFDKLERNRSMVLIESSMVTMSVPSINSGKITTVSTTFERLSDTDECVVIYTGMTVSMLNCYNYKISGNKLTAKFVNYDEVVDWSGKATFQILQYSYIGGN